MTTVSAPSGFPAFGSFGRCDELYGAWASERPHWEDMGGIAMTDAATDPSKLAFCGLDPFGDGEGTVFVGREKNMGQVWVFIRQWLESSVRTFDPDIIVSTREGSCLLCARFTSFGYSAVWLAGRLCEGMDTKLPPLPEAFGRLGEDFSCSSHMRGTPAALLEILLSSERHFMMSNPGISELFREISEGAAGIGNRSAASIVPRLSS